MTRKILIVEDDRDIIDLIEIHLNDFGFNLKKTYTGNDGLKKALAESFDLIILDVMLPGMDGIEVCRNIREKDKVVPILMLTARSEEMDKILGLEIGANDYITKPFSIRELIARINSNLRSIKAVKEHLSDDQKPEHVEIGELYIDFNKRKVVLSGTTIDLTAKEFDLLSHFALHPGRSFTREKLLNDVWGYQFSGYDHTVNSHINRLRAKIETDPAKPKFIKTVWGVGYRFCEPEELSQ